MCLLDAIITFAFSKFTSDADEVDRLPRVTVSLRCKGCGKRDDIVINDIIVEGVLPSTKNRLELVCIVVVEVDISGVNELSARLPTDSIILVSFEIATTEMYAVRSSLAPDRES